MSLVLDCSVTLAWLLPDEDSRPVQAVLDRIVASRAWVPNLWRLCSCYCLAGRWGTAAVGGGEGRRGCTTH